MRGDWLATTRRVFHEETFDTIVSPAIADLQFESSSAGWVRSARGYAGVCVAIAGALGGDLAGDLRALSGDAWTLSRLVLMQTCYYTCLLTLMSGLTTSGHTTGRAVDQASGSAALAVAVVIVGLSTIPTLLCFWPARRNQTTQATPG
jgi:hypothetical protein